MAGIQTPPPPKSPFELTIRVGGETWDDTLRAVDRLAEHIRDHGPECNMASGGAGSNSSVQIEHREVTPEQYREELEAWCEARRRRSTPSPPHE